MQLQVTRRGKNTSKRLRDKSNSCPIMGRSSEIGRTDAGVV